MEVGTVRARISADLFTVETGAEESYSFDRAGCLVRAAWAGTATRWGLDGGCLIKERRPFGSPREREFLPPAAGLARAATAYEQSLLLLQRLPSLPLDWADVMALIREQGSDLMRRRAEAFARTYRPVSILPPDQYGALVLQLTEGCRYNCCSFCTFYRGRPYRVKTTAEFEAHVREALALVGPAINRRRTVFLGDANALALPFADLTVAFEVMNRWLPVRARPAPASAGLGQATGDGIEGIYTFMDVYDRRPMSVEQFARLAELGLRRVYIGAESGSTLVLRKLRKPGYPAKLAAAVEAMKAGGLGVGLIFLLGAGGDKYAAEHAAATASLLASLSLDAHDIVYFSELVTAPGGDYDAWAQREGVRELSCPEMRAQEREMRRGLRPVEAGGPRVTRYDVREFIYY